jgi:hypothetical protein
MIQVSLKNHQVIHDYATSTRVKFVTHIVTTTSDSKYLFFGHFNNLNQFEINDSSHKLVKRYHFTSNVNCVLITSDNKYLFAGLDSGDIDHIDLETHALVIRYNAVTERAVGHMTILSEDQMIVGGKHRQPLVYLSLKKQKVVSKINI